MTPNEIIYRIHHDAMRPEIHERPADYRKAVKRESVWDSLRTDEKRLAIALAEGEWSLLDVALEDIADGAAITAQGV